MTENEAGSAPEASTTATDVTSAAPSMEDTIRSTLADINSRGSDEQAGSKAAPTDTQGGPGRTRDTGGRFAKAGATDAGGGSAAAVPAEAPATTDAPVVDKHAEPPKSWNATEKAEWAAMTPGQRAAVHRREEDFHRGIEGYRGKATHFDALHAVISPHADIIQQSGQNAIENISGLLNWQRTLYSGNATEKVASLLTIAANVGIKPEEIVEGLNNPRSAPAQDPRYDSLSRELQQTREMMSQMQMAPVMSQIESFFADSKNEFAGEQEVQDQMLMLIRSGVTKDLRVAYDKACKLSDSVSSKLEARKREAEAKQKAELAAKAAKASSINVRTRGATPVGQAAKGTMEDTIRSQLAQMKAEGRA